jgi:hypothetical protein
MSGHGMGSTYVLTGNDSELKTHIGHKVEVIGTVGSTSGGDEVNALNAGILARTAILCAG